LSFAYINPYFTRNSPCGLQLEINKTLTLHTQGGPKKLDHLKRLQLLYTMTQKGDP